MKHLDPRPHGEPTSGLTSLFVRRPVLAIVINLLILVGGLAALSGVAVRELPEVDSPVVTVTAEYTGASAETMDQEVTDILEAAAGRVSGVKSISSQSQLGTSRVTVEFTDTTDLDVAASDVRNEISQIVESLPDDLEEPSIVKADADDNPVMRVSVTSDEMPIEDLSTIVDDVISDQLIAVAGVADVETFGTRDKIFQIDIDHTKLSVRSLTVADIRTVLANAAFDVPAGEMSRKTQNLTVRATTALKTPADFERLIVKDGTRLGDVANVTLGPDLESTTLRSGGKTGVGLNLIKQSGSNTLDISNGVRAKLEELKKTLPDNIEMKVNSDDAIFVRGAIEEVLKSLAMAIAIVVAVIYLFLLNARATFIPAVTLPIALVGTVAGIWLVGFSINIITLLALVLATGMVVDDAIVVLENIVKKRSAGMPAGAAAVIGTQEVFFAVITTTATLAAVFIPLSFLPGKAGGLFREFGYVLAIAVTISSLVALSLCPMLASRLLSGEKAIGMSRGLLGRNVARFGSWASRCYASMLGFCLKTPILVLTLAAVFATTAWFTLGTLREEITPAEDRSVALLRVVGPQSVSLDYTDSQLKRIEGLLQPYQESGELENVLAISGFSSSTNNGFMVMRLAPWNERERGQQEIVDEISAKLRSIASVRAFVIQPNSLGIRGGGSGLRIAIVGNDYSVLAKAADELSAELEKDPDIGRIRLSYESTQPQLSINVDRERASDIGIAIDELEHTIQAMLEGNDAGDVFVGGQAITMKLLASTSPVNDTTDLENIFFKASNERYVPMSSFASIVESPVAPTLTREEKRRAVTLTIELPSGIALREAMNRVETAAQDILPPDNYLLPLSEAATLNETSTGLAKVFAFAIVIVILVLAAQFESFVSSLIIVFTVPLGLACAVFALWFSGTSLNVYSQIGLVLLVGIMAKNGILIVEFANQLRDRGASAREAAEQAAQQRLRPVMMTMVSTVLGGLPLVLASGAGAEARVALGWVIIGGLGLATIATLFVTPVAYSLLAGLSTPKTVSREKLDRELEAAG